MLNILLTLEDVAGIKRPIDDRLILRISQGDMNAFQELYDSASKAVYGFALSILKNSHDAEDVLQETFLKVYNKSADYSPSGKPMAWIFTIARNLSLTKLREAAKKTELDEQRPETVDFSAVADAEQRMLIETMFRVLTDEEKQIIMLHALSGLKHREIASILDLPTSTVLSKYHRAIKRLKTVIEEEN